MPSDRCLWTAARVAQGQAVDKQTAEQRQSCSPRTCALAAAVRRHNAFKTYTGLLFISRLFISRWRCRRADGRRLYAADLNALDRVGDPIRVGIHLRHHLRPPPQCQRIRRRTPWRRARDMRHSGAAASQHNPAGCQRTEWRPTAPHRWSREGSSDPRMMTPTTICRPVEASYQATGLPESPAPTRCTCTGRH